MIDATQMMPAAEERYEVIQDNRGLIWISTFGYGLFVYNPQEDIISHYTYQETGKNLVHSNFLHSLLLDHSGNVWVGSEFAGVTLLSVLSEGSYRIYPEHENMNDYVNAIRTVFTLMIKIWRLHLVIRCHTIIFMRLLVMEMVNYGWEPVRWVYVLTDVGIIKWRVIPCHWHMRIYSIFIVMIKIGCG